jgi:hypothetical protein
MNQIAKTLIIIVSAFFVITGCNDFESANTSSNDALVEIEALKIEPVIYATDIKTIATNGNLEETFFTIPTKAEAGRKVTVSFKFNSKNSDKLKVIRNRLKTSCSGNKGNFEYHLVKRSSENELVYENLNPVFDYKLEKNTDYSYDAISSPDNCSKVEIGVALWTGDSKTEPAIVKSCFYNSVNDKDIFYYFPNQSPPTAFLAKNQKIFGQDLVCGQKLEISALTYSKDPSNGSIEGEYKPEDGSIYSFYVLFNEEIDSGELVCAKNGIQFENADLSSCQDKILDRNDFTL